MTSIGARLNFNEKPIIKWKGKTFSQVSAGVKFNTTNNNVYGGIGFNGPEFHNSNPSTTKVSVYNLMRPLPLKIYRREIASKTVSCNPRTSLKIDDFNRPGAVIITNVASTTNTGLVNTIDFNYINNSCEHPPNPISSDKTCNEFLNPQVNARRRLRCSGNIKKFNNVTNKNTYYTDRAQYLKSRNLSYETNSTFHIVSGNASANPGTKQANPNVYASNSSTDCSGGVVKVYFNPNNPQFGVQGAVSGGDYITRKKYDTITNAAASVRKAYGPQTTDALAYGVPFFGYTKKDTTGYPNTKTPTISKYSGLLSKCDYKSINGLRQRAR